MASEKNLNAVFTDIANAIRTKKGTTAKIQPINMATEITNLSGGGERHAVLSVTENGTYFPNTGTVFSEVRVNVPQNAGSGSGEAIELSVTANGIYAPGEGKSYSKVSVRVPQTIGNLETTELSITQNGMYVPDEGAAYSKVSVNVPQTAESGTLKALLDTTKSSRYLFRGYTGIGVNGLISYSDTSNVTNTAYMFYECTSLIGIPQLDTSNVIDMDSMFSNCSALRTIPELDTSKVTDMPSMFYKCSALTSIPQLNTSKVIRMSSAFANCSRLSTIPALDVSNVGEMNYIFYNCSSLKSVLMYGMKVNFDISASTEFEKSDLVTILNNLAPVTSTTTLTMGATNLAKLTDEEKAIAINKGWTLA